MLNLGVNGYWIENYLYVGREQFVTLKPDVVVIGFCLDDIPPRATFDYVAEGARARLKAWLSHSVGLRLLVWTARRLRHDPEAYRIAWAREAEAAWTDPSAQWRLRHAVGDIRDFAQGSSAELVAGASFGSPSGHLIGIDMDAALRIADARGCDLAVLSELLPVADAGLVEALSSDRGRLR